MRVEKPWRKTMRRPSVILIAAAVVSLCAAAAAAEQRAYPVRPIKIVVDRPAGVPHDLLARALAEKLSANLGQTVVVENRAGAGGNLASEFVARSTPDGYTLLVALDTTLTVNPILYKSLQTDPIKVLRPLSVMGQNSNMLVVHPSVPVHSVAEFVAYAKTHPITYGHGGNGSPGHLTMEYFRMLADFPAVSVPYRGNTQVVVDLLSGEIKFGFIGTAGVIKYVRAEQLRGLAVSGNRRVEAAPELPTIAESGYPGFEVQTSYAILAPAGLPDPIAKKLELAIQKALKSPDIKDRFQPLGIEITASSAEEASARLQSERTIWKKVIDASGMHID
jgi:tripartite-type tricarboxylate transporter receptor subunit TctC